ncbi:MAG: hydrogenase formation protein HypD [Anaerolineae bacterium]|nr:hydrogenase formation protein HypD [Anaerolineae bacterium]
MKYVDEFRDPGIAQRLIDEIARRSTRPVELMEFCGGHTHAILKTGLRQVLPERVHLRSGPGCPVCVTSATDLEHAIALSRLPGVILTTYGDMVRIPGSQGSLQEARATGADVRIVYSTLDALDIARRNPDRAVVFLAVGFETTAPTTAAALLQAEAEGVPNLSVLCLHKLTPPATRAILDAGEVRLDGVLGPGHVTTIIGAAAWRFLPEEYGISCVVTGFEPLDILRGVGVLVAQFEGGQPAVRNAYGRSVRADGNRVALEMMGQVYRVATAEWRGLGALPKSGLLLRDAYAHRDAARIFEVKVPHVAEPKGCRCGEVLRGVISPLECALFGATCSPRNPVGPCMVSSEGACAAYHAYGGAA